MSSAAPQGSKSKSVILTKHPLLSADGHQLSVSAVRVCVYDNESAALDRQRVRRKPIAERDAHIEVHAVQVLQATPRESRFSLSHRKHRALSVLTHAVCHTCIQMAFPLPCL